MFSTSTIIKGSGDTSETVDPGTTMESNHPTTMPSNCTDMSPPESCTSLVTKIESQFLQTTRCKKTLMNWIEKLSEKEVCHDNDMMPVRNTRMDDLDNRMEPCTDEDEWDLNPLRHCSHFLKRLERAFNYMVMKCRMTAGIMKKNLMTKKVDCLLTGQD